MFVCIHISMVTNTIPTKLFHLESGKYLLLVLKIFILCSGSFNNDINIILEDGLNAFGINNSHVTNEIACLFVCLFVCLFGVYHPTREFFTHHCRWRAPNSGLCSALMAIEQWGFFNVPHLLRHGPTVYNGHLRGTHTCCRAFGSGAVTTCFYELFWNVLCNTNIWMLWN